MSLFSQNYHQNRLKKQPLKNPYLSYDAIRLCVVANGNLFLFIDI